MRLLAFLWAALAASFSAGNLKDREADPLHTSLLQDSATVVIRAGYDKAGRFHRKLFGENYRKEWAVETKLPVIKISEVHGGLTPTRRGGGMQSKSLRLEDADGREWVLRSVEKVPDLLLPSYLRETFARDWVDDAQSAQHPYSALIVPPIADAVNVPHANPVIGLVAPDERLGGYAKDFEGTVCLLEEREPLGDSDNTPKMLEKLKDDNDNRYDGEAFLRARLLDLLVGDWDRHEDQWRWADTDDGGDKFYVGVPRDRDQVLRVAQGVFPRLAKKRWIAPTLQGFGGKIEDVRYSLFKTRFIHPLPASQISYEKWMAVTTDFVATVTDSVLEAALKRLPASAYQLRHEWLLQSLKERRDNIPAAMHEYYHFINKVVDIRLSDKHEKITLRDTAGNALYVLIRKINKEGIVTDTLMSHVYDPSVTREIRLYTGEGNDSVTADIRRSPVKIRVIGAQGKKVYAAEEAVRKMGVYGDDKDVTVNGKKGRIKTHLSADSLNSAFVPVNLYHVTMPLAMININADDGLLLGAGFKHTHQEGFRKIPFAWTQQLMVTHSFSTEAFRIRYKGEWTDVLGRADLVIEGQANAPNNTINFFGRGNETAFDKAGDYKRYYRTRFNTFQLDPVLRWKEGNTSLSIGPSLQYYTMSLADNAGRFITNPQMIGSYDSLTLSKDRFFAGLTAFLEHDSRTDPLLPSDGMYAGLRFQYYEGLTASSRSFVQFTPEVSFYRSLNSTATVVIADRIGGGVTFGKTAFYQSLFLGGHDNLLGYRQYRFAGQHMLYNNLEVRVKLSDIRSYILPGQVGLMAFYDTGRVWEEGERSDKWHHGTGGGLYFSPVGMTLFRFLAGYSEEGWYPYVAMKFRF